MVELVAVPCHCRSIQDVHLFDHVYNERKPALSHRTNRSGMFRGLRFDIAGQKRTLIFLIRQVKHPVLLRVYLGRFRCVVSWRGTGEAG